jgi:hypothetical protein
MPKRPDVETIRYAAHVAHLDALSGEGLLVLPPVADDVCDPLGHGSLHAADWDAVVRHLDGLGWEPTEAEDGGLCYVGRTRDGRAVIGLFGREPVTGTPSIPEQAAAVEALGRLADLH